LILKEEIPFYLPLNLALSQRERGPNGYSAIALDTENRPTEPGNDSNETSNP
jgi:hypothetical protein